MGAASVAKICQSTMASSTCIVVQRAGRAVEPGGRSDCRKRGKAGIPAAGRRSGLTAVDARQPWDKARFADGLSCSARGLVFGTGYILRFDGFRQRMPPCLCLWTRPPA